MWGTKKLEKLVAYPTLPFMVGELSLGNSLLALNSSGLGDGLCRQNEATFSCVIVLKVFCCAVLLKFINRTP